MSICTALIVMGAILGAGLFLLEWKMPGFLMTSIKNGIANGRAYAEKRHEMKEKGRPYTESFNEFSKGLGRTITFKPPQIDPISFPKKVKKSKRKTK